MSLSHRKQTFPFEAKKKRYGSYLAWRISPGYLMKHFDLKYRESDPISHFIYQVNGEADREFLSAMETWVRETLLLQGSVQLVLDSLTLLSVCRIDPNQMSSVKMVRWEVIRYVRDRWPR